MAGRFERKKKMGLVAGLAVVILAALLCVLFAGSVTEDREDSEVYSEQFALRLEGDDLVLTGDADCVREIKAMLSAAEDIGFEPKTYILGPELVYIGMDGQEVLLELDMDSDLFRYNGRFFDYGPGNDNNAMPRLLNLLGLNDWPEEVKAAYPERFGSFEGSSAPVVTGDRRQSVYMDLWYPDWHYLKIQEPYALVILEAMEQENPMAVDRNMIAVEDSVFTIHIAYDDQRELDLACIGDGDFLLWECGTERVYSFSSMEFRKTVDEMIALS